MEKLQILNTREIKRIKQLLDSEFGYALEEEYAYLQNQKGRIFIITKEIAALDFAALRIDKMGLYFAESKDNQLRLSKEGAQLLVQEARKHKKEVKNIVSLNKEEVTTYFQGHDLGKDCGNESRFVLLDYKNNILGCAKYREGKIFNFLPKIHRGEVIV